MAQRCAKNAYDDCGSLMLDLRVMGGLVAHLHGQPQQQSIGIRDGYIVAVGDLADLPSRVTLDVGGCLVLPGLIDTHVHLGFTDQDREWGTETQLAAIGGVTTPLIYFRSTEQYGANLTDFIDRGAAHSFVDFGVHLGILNDVHLADFDRLVEHYGIRSIKMYTTYKDGSLARFGVMGQDDGFILDVMHRAAARGDVVVNVHCENDDIVKRGQRFWAEGVTEPAARWAAMRPAIAEVEAIHRIGLFARETGARIHLPHVSSRRAIQAAISERRLGAQLSIETCPQYLMPRLASQSGRLVKVNPPVRPDEDGADLWGAFRSGELDTLGTDHACWCRVDKEAESIIDVSPGFPGLGTLLPLMMDNISRGLITPSDLVRVNARAAQIFDLPHHGQLLPGFRADLAVVDTTLRREVTPEQLGGLSDFSPWEGNPLTGWPVLTISRGQVVARDGKIVGEPTGKYVRDLYRQAKGR
jgi:dihydroorotase-like cyclic amidohydrolase